MRILIVAAAFTIAVLVPCDAIAQGSPPAPPERLPAASPPPRPVPDSASLRAPLLAPARPAPPPAPLPRTGATPPGAAASVAPQPANATMRCKDGSWLTTTRDAASCRDRGGVAVILPEPPAPPPPAPRRP